MVNVQYWPSVDRYIDRDINLYATDISTDILADILTDISTDISRLICRSSVGQYVDRHIGQVLVNMSTDTRPMYRPIYRPIHRWRGAQNTQDPCNQIKLLVNLCSAIKLYSYIKFTTFRALQWNSLLKLDSSCISTFPVMSFSPFYM